MRLSPPSLFTLMTSPDLPARGSPKALVARGEKGREAPYWLNLRKLQEISAERKETRSKDGPSFENDPKRRKGGFYGPRREDARAKPLNDASKKLFVPTLPFS